MADFLPFCFSHAYQIYFLLAKMAASYSYFSLAILDVEGRLKNLSFQEGFRNVLLLLYLFWKSLDQEKGK